MPVSGARPLIARRTSHRLTGRARSQIDLPSVKELRVRACTARVSGSHA